MLTVNQYKQGYSMKTTSSHRMILYGVIFIIILVFYTRPLYAEFIINGSFEDIFVSRQGQGLLPLKWINTGPLRPGADTFSNDGSYGLYPDAFDIFTGAKAYNGKRWIGCWSWGPKSIAQNLAKKLQPGSSYKLSAFIRMATRPDIAHAGTFMIALATDITLRSKIILGQFDPVNKPNTWVKRELIFIAPEKSLALPILVFTPVAFKSKKKAYIGLDLVGLTEQFNFNGSESETEITIQISGDVLFDFNAYTIRNEAEVELQKVVTILKKHPDASVLIKGHTDSKGSEDYNLKLSRERAQAVKNWLVTVANFDEHHINIVGLGESKPIALNKRPDGSDNIEGRKKNRRVEIIVKKK